jgi:hypothetical protein
MKKQPENYQEAQDERKAKLSDPFNAEDIKREGFLHMLVREADQGDEPITNTSRKHSTEHLAEALTAGTTDGMIEASESRGQREMVDGSNIFGKTRLPAEGTLAGRHGREQEFDWSRLGITIGNVVDRDEIWVEAILPEGWKIVASDHAMWSHLHDDKGRERAAIFYKAAFYDRSCNIRPTRRYKAQTKSASKTDEWSLEGPQICVIEDAGKEIHRLGPFDSKPEPDDKYARGWRAADQAEAAGEAYMKEHYPDWEDQGAYWD